MEWVRKNLGFVIGLAVAVVLLGVGLWYTLGTMEESSMADGELQAKRQQLDDLVKRDPFPEQANIDLAREEEEKVTAFIRDARKKFAIRELPDSLDNASFKSLLESTLADLAREAELAGVKLPDKASFSSYSFTLEDQRKQLQLPSSSLVPLAAHLENLAVISRVLFDAKVHSLVSLKRSSVGTNELAGSGDFLSKKVVTNTALNTVVYPYEVVFQGFSPELAKVITGLVNAPQAFVIKTLNVERGSLDSMPAQPAFGAPMAIPGLPPGMDPALARRYGMFGPRPQQMPVAAQQPVTTGRPGEVVLEEKPLQVKLGLEIISLLPAKEPPDPVGARVRRSLRQPTPISNSPITAAMDFLKKHYEKLIFSVVLLVVAVTAFWLTQRVESVRSTLADQLSQTGSIKKKPLKPVELSNDLAALRQVSQNYRLDFPPSHNVFNPIRWKRGTDGVPRPDPERDLANALKLLATQPLPLTIEYLGPTGTGDPFRYQFRVTREYDKKVSNRRPITVSLTEGTKNDWFYLREVRGPKDSAGEVVIELIDGGERATLAKEKPFSRPRGYQADLKFENKDYPRRRVDDSINILGSIYKIVAIGKDEIVVSAPNGTRTTIPSSTL